MIVSADRIARPPLAGRGFYLGLSLYMAGLMTLGFWPSYFALVLGDAAELPLFVHVHAAVFVSWMLLFVAQASLIATRRVAQHRRVGRIGIAWGFLVLAVGSITTLLSFARRIELTGIDTASAFLIWPLLDMIIFAAFFVPAVVYRSRPELHKRFMVVAVTNLLVAAVGRVVGLDTLVMHTLNVLLWTSPILIAMAYDFVGRRIVHPIYVAGLVVLAGSSFRDWVGDSNPWFDFSQWLGGLVT